MTGERRFHPSHMLVVDDDDLNRMVLTQVLSTLGMTYIAVENGEKAIEALHQERFDLVLMDLHMPVMDGWTACKIWREQESQAGILQTPIVAMTAEKVTPESARRYAAFDAMLEKPLTPKKLELLIHGSIQRPDKSIEQSESPDPPAQAPLLLPIDPHEMKKLSGILGDTLDRLLMTYIENGTKLLDQIKGGVNRGDLEEVASRAHALRGSSRTVTAHQVEATAAQIEQQSRSGCFPSPESLDRLVTEFMTVCSALQAYRCAPLSVIHPSDCNIRV